jgi:ATP:cob(I)alamin adenosyltransferase
MEHIFTIHEFKQASLLRFIITKRKIRNYEKYLEIALQRYVYDVSHKMDINTAFLTVVQDAELFDNAAALLKYFASVIDINDALCQIGQTVETFGLSIRNVEKVIPPIHTFILSGGSESSAYLDITRTYARKTERKYVHLINQEPSQKNQYTSAYLNRLSSTLYALARFTNYQLKQTEQSPTYI